MNILFIIKVKILVLIKPSYRSPSIMLTIEPRTVIVFWVHKSNLFKTQVFLVSILGATPNHTSLKYRCPIKNSNQIRHVYLSL